MALNANSVKKPEGNVNKQEALEAGNYLARVVQVYDLGLQAQKPYMGQEKPPAHMLSITYELVTEFCKDEKGEDMEDKPRFISETFPLRHISVELATSTKRLKAIDPKGEAGGDFTKLIGMSCTVTIVQDIGKGKHAGKIFTSIGAVTPPMKGIPVPELINDPRVFVLDDPDLEVFNNIPEWLQNKIVANLNFSGSKLEKLLTGGSSSVEEKEPDTQEDDNDEDVPY